MRSPRTQQQQLPSLLLLVKTRESGKEVEPSLDLYAGSAHGLVARQLESVIRDAASALVHTHVLEFVSPNQLNAFMIQ